MGDARDFPGTEDASTSGTDVDESSSSKEGESSEKFDSVRKVLSGGASKVREAASRPFSYLASSGSGTSADANPDYSEEATDNQLSSTRRGYIFALGAGTGAIAAGSAGVIASDAAEGELGDGEYGVPWSENPDFGDNNGFGTGGNTTQTPSEADKESSSTPSDVQTQIPEEIQTTTSPRTTTEDIGYRGEIDGRGYEVVDIPGRNAVDVVPDDAAGFKVDEDLLSSYDSDAWYDISSDESGPESFGFDDLGASTEWYVTRDAVIGVDTRDKEVVRFTHDEFGYDTQALYEDIQEDIK